MNSSFAGDNSLAHWFAQQIRHLKPGDLDYVPHLIDAIFAAARNAEVTDIHLEPCANGYEMRWRIDGVLQTVAEYSSELGSRMVTRLKVLSRLLTYRSDIPQEGRLLERNQSSETRVSTFPAIFGEKVVMRLFSGSEKFRSLDDLGLSADVVAELRSGLNETGGVILLTGPAGSGKTTTNYACLRELIHKNRRGRNLVSLEDPVEVVVPGVTQSLVNPAAGFDLTTGLRSLLRQDPEVIMVGEIRDRVVAETVFQASLSGHLVLTTFHAGSAVEAVCRLSDMEIEPYLLRSGIQRIVCQRLMRRLCECAHEEASDDLPAGLSRHWQPVGCKDCSGTGYKGRFVIAEVLNPRKTHLGRSVLSRKDVEELNQIAIESGMISQRQRAFKAVEEGETSLEEVFRVLGTNPVDDERSRKQKLA